jgi:hypothetical protein
MKKLSVFVIGVFCCLALSFFCGTKPSFAEDISSIGIATYMPVTGKVEDGDIISSSKNGYTLSEKAYDSQVVGVIAKQPAIALKTDNQQQGVPVVNVGTVVVKVTGEGGDIKKGDYVTTSSVKGAGMKSTRSGYIIGQAAESATFTEKDQIKFMIVSLNLHFLQVGNNVSSSLFDIFALSQLAAYEEPVRVFKYVISAIVLIASFVCGFVIFSRTINTGIQALGRNPLAGRMIQLSILFNVVLVIIIIMSGIGLVWLFLRL